MKKLREFRKKIDKITNKFVRLIAKRQKLVLEIRKLKKKKGLPIIDWKREKEILRNSAKLAKKLRLNQTLIKKIMSLLIKDARKIQKK